MIEFQWRFTRRFWLLLLLAAFLASNLGLSRTTTVQATTNYREVMQARNFTWFAFPYIAQLEANVVYDNGSGYWEYGCQGCGDFIWIRRPKMWKAGSYVYCQLEGLVAQTLVSPGCNVTRISRTKVEVHVVWKQEVKVLGIGIERMCSMRAWITTPDAQISNRRWGGDC